jgi:hypothetical protein
MRVVEPSRVRFEGTVVEPSASLGAAFHLARKVRLGREHHDPLVAGPQHQLARVAERLPCDAPIEARGALAAAAENLDSAAAFARYGELEHALGQAFIAGTGCVEAWLLVHAPKAFAKYDGEHKSTETQQARGQRYLAKVAEYVRVAVDVDGLSSRKAQATAIDAALDEYRVEAGYEVERRVFTQYLYRWRKAQKR